MSWTNCAHYFIFCIEIASNNVHYWNCLTQTLTLLNKQLLPPLIRSHCFLPFFCSNLISISLIYPSAHLLQQRFEEGVTFSGLMTHWLMVVWWPNWHTEHISGVHITSSFICLSLRPAALPLEMCHFLTFF